MFFYMIGVEEASYLETPLTEGYPSLPEGTEFKFRFLSGDRVEVHHPFHGVTVLGDGRHIETPYLDRAAVVLFQKFAYLLDSRKLSRPDQYATRPFAGRFSELSACFSLGMMAADMGGGPIDILDALFNDVPKLYNGHQGDDNYWGHGKEDGHDRERVDFFKRAGLIEDLIAAEVLRPKGETLYVGPTRLTIESLLDEDEVTVRQSFLSNKHHARRMDLDRFQYNEEERFYLGLALHLDKSQPTRLPRALADLALSTIARRVVVEDGEGDQLIFLDKEAAKLSAIDYIRHNTEHWCEPVQDLVSDMLNIAERYLFLCSHPDVEMFQYFYPRDYLHAPATMIHELMATVARDDPAMAWLLDTVARIAEDQRAKAVTYDTGMNCYSGPNPPDWVTIEPIKQQDFIEPLFQIDEQDNFVIVLPRGKLRDINPRVQKGSRSTFALSEEDSDFVDFKTHQHQWIGDYKASIHIDDAATAHEVRRAIQRINEQWRNILATRPFMPDTVFRQTLKESNDFILRQAQLA